MSDEERAIRNQPDEDLNTDGFNPEIEDGSRFDSSEGEGENLEEGEDDEVDSSDEDEDDDEEEIAKVYIGCIAY